MSLGVSNQIMLVTILIASGSATMWAQTAHPGITNPLMRMIASQPTIDITSPVVATASLEPVVVRPGEKAVYRITFNALEASIRLPDQIPEPDGLRIRASAHGQVLQTGTNALRPFTTFNFDVRAEKPGLYVVPPLIAAVEGKPVSIPEAGLEARASLPESHRPVRQLILECDATNVFIGQTINVRVLSPAWESNIVQALTQVQFNGDGFLPNKSAAKQTIETIEREGRKIPTYIHKTTVTPITSGQHALSVQGFTAGRHFSGPITIRGSVTIPGGPPEFLLLDSEPVNVNVSPLPTEGKPAGFTGGIGVFELDPPVLATNIVLVGDPVQLAVTIRSSADLGRLEPPPAPRVKGWQVFPANFTGMVAGTPNTNPGAVFNYTLIPTTDEVRKTPAIPFSYFDPRKAAYVDLTIPSVPITVIAHGLPTDLPKALQSTEEESTPQKKPTLSDLAAAPGRLASSFVPLQLRGWFLAVQLVPAIGFLMLWLWDERRRHLELHPEIVRCRAARRQLRRQRRLLRRAATAGDAAAYIRCAVGAMQIACAPHYIAEPGALVCGDVLNILDAKERQGRSGEVIRRFFAAADNSRFAVSPQILTSVEIVASKAEVDRILMNLEDRL